MDADPHAKPDISGVDLAALPWRTSSRDSGADARIEVATLPDGVAVRDSSRPDGPVLLFTPAEWDAFVAGARDGEFDDLA
jgi:hypothetical protein